MAAAMAIHAQTGIAAATEQFQRALEIDPTYEAARRNPDAVLTKR